MTKKATLRPLRLAGYVLLWAIALLHVYPLILILFSALKSKSELAYFPFSPPKDITFEHFATAFETMHYFRSLFNTVLITVLSVGLITLIASAAGYAIARRGGRFYNGLYLFFLAGMIVPFQMTMIPLYKLVIKLNLINSYTGVTSVYLSLLIPFSLFFYTGFVKNVPRELEEAALIDGAGMLKTFLHIVFPLLKPATATVTVLNAFIVWNDFLLPLLFLPSGNKMTLVVQLFNFVGQYFNNWSPIFAAIMLIVYPMLIMYLFSQRFMIKGITAGATKG